MPVPLYLTDKINVININRKTFKNSLKTIENLTSFTIKKLVTLASSGPSTLASR